MNNEPTKEIPVGVFACIAFGALFWITVAGIVISYLAGWL